MTAKCMGSVRDGHWQLKVWKSMGWWGLFRNFRRREGAEKEEVGLSFKKEGGLPIASYL